MDDAGFSFNKIMLNGEPKSGYSIGYTPSHYEAIYAQVSNRLANDLEGKIRASLIELGWTPPPNAKNPPQLRSGFNRMNVG